MQTPALIMLEITFRGELGFFSVLELTVVRQSSSLECSLYLPDPETVQNLG